MKLKLTGLFILLVTISACRKEFTSYRPTTLQKETYTSIEPSVTKEEIVDFGSGLPAEGQHQVLSAENDKDKGITNKVIERKKTSTFTPYSDPKKIENKRSHAKKEMNPRLSRALWMMIPGGLAVILGILLYSVAPTGLFIFAFSIVFLVGLVSFILYLANPKPKM